MQFKTCIVLLFFVFTVVSCKKQETPKPAPIPPGTPTISNFTIPSKHIGDGNFIIIPPISSSAGDFTYSSDNPAIAVIKGDSIQIKGVGKVNITATQKANGSYTAGSIAAVFTVLGNAYISGWSYDASGALISMYWKNGGLTNLAGNGMATGIMVQNGDIYISGAMANGSIYTYPGYWKDGVQHILSTKNGEAMAIAVVGTDVYVAGFTDTFDASDDLVATLWKNGVEMPLKNPVTCCGAVGTSMATGIAVYNNTVYVCGVATGGSFSSAMIWKTDGTATALNTPPPNGQSNISSNAFAITFQGSDMYLCGATADQLANFYLTYWKNGMAVPLSAAAVNNSTFAAITVNGTDVYTAGIDEANNILNAALWKNGNETLLSANGEANGIAVDGGDVYVAGDTFVYTNGFVATPVYWLNGAAVTLQAPNNTRASAIVIEDQ